MKSISDHKAKILRFYTLLQSLARIPLTACRHVTYPCRDPKRTTSNLHSSPSSSSHLFSQKPPSTGIKALYLPCPIRCNKSSVYELFYFTLGNTCFYQALNPSLLPSPPTSTFLMRKESGIRNDLLNTKQHLRHLKTESMLSSHCGGS